MFKVTLSLPIIRTGTGYDFSDNDLVRLNFEDQFNEKQIEPELGKLVKILTTIKSPNDFFFLVAPAAVEHLQRKALEKTLTYYNWDERSNSKVLRKHRDIEMTISTTYQLKYVPKSHAIGIRKKISPFSKGNTVSCRNPLALHISSSVLLF